MRERQLILLLDIYIFPTVTRRGSPSSRRCANIGKSRVVAGRIGVELPSIATLSRTGNAAVAIQSTAVAVHPALYRSPSALWANMGQRALASKALVAVMATCILQLTRRQ